MVTVIDEKGRGGGKAVRTLQYSDAVELTGSKIQTVNFGLVECELGSVAIKAGFNDMKQLGDTGWVDC